MVLYVWLQMIVVRCIVSIVLPKSSTRYYMGSRFTRPDWHVQEMVVLDPHKEAVNSDAVLIIRLDDIECLQDASPHPLQKH